MLGVQSIRRRLQGLLVLTTGVGLALACIIFTYLEWRAGMSMEEQAALSRSRITADAASGTLAFKNPEEAQSLLSAFRVEPDVRGAVLRLLDGTVYAEYYRFPQDRPATPPVKLGVTIEGKRLHVVHPVTQGEEVYGTLYLQTDLADIYDRLYRYAAVAALIFVAALSAASFLGRFLERTVSGPILALAETARAISQDHNYDIRAVRVQGRELGLLTAAFNQMLEQIQHQQGQLRSELHARQQAQESEAREKQLLATTLASIGDAVIVTDVEGRITFLNREAERLTAWGADEASGRPLLEVFRIFNEDTREPVENPVHEVLRSGMVAGLANHRILIARDGRETPIDDSAAPIQQPGGPLFGVVLVFRDFTEQKHAQQTRARLAAIVEFSGDAIITNNMRGIVQTWNGGAERLFGYGAEEMIGKPISLLIPKNRLEEEGRLLAGVRRGELVQRLETSRIAKSGREIPVALSVSPIKDSEGQIVGASKIVHDITDVVAAREALIREKELLSTTLASIGDGVIVTDARGRVTLLNGEAERLTGWSQAEAEGLLLADVFRIIQEESRLPAEDPVTKVLETGLVAGLANHTLLLRRDGTEMPIDDSAAPIRRGDGPLSGVVLVFRDFSEKKQIQLQLLQHAAELEKVVNERTAKLRETIHELEAFSYSIAHDMRAPLRAMQGYANMLQEEYAPVLKDDGSEYLRRISASANRLDQLIQDVLDYSKIVRAELKLEPVDTERFLWEIIQSYPNLQAPQAEIILDGPFPWVCANPAALTQVVSNLLGNAVKFVRSGVKPRVRIWAEPGRSPSPERHVRLWFEDNGIGIRQEAQDRIFSMFQRLNPPGRYEGTGIGLTIVRKAVERMGGSVGVESEPNRGSKFWIELREGTRI